LVAHFVQVARGRGRTGFGNAGAVRKLFEQVTEAASLRLKQQPDLRVLKTIDVIGEDPTKNERLQEALAKLHRFDGLKKVKEAINELVETAVENYKLELSGKEVFGDGVDDDEDGGGVGEGSAGARKDSRQKYQVLALNRLFLGNPGTGKSSIADIYGTILKELKYLTDGRVVSKKASDFIGSEVGASQKKTREII